MTEYTSLEVSKRLIEAGFIAPTNAKYTKGMWGEDKDEWKLYLEDQEWSHKKEWYVVAAYRSDTLLAWLLSHGDSIEITPDLDGFNCTFWKDHHDYNGISIFLPDALAEVVMKVLEVSK